MATFTDVKLSTRIIQTAKKYKCQFCKLKYATEIQCAAHEAKHKKNMECSICGYTTTSYLVLTEHLASHFSNESKYQCPVVGCHKDFFYYRSFKQHLIIHSGYKCIEPTCSRRGKRFSTRRSLEDHVKKHIGLLKYSCDICPNKRFPKESQLKNHKKTKGHIELANFQLRQTVQATSVSNELNFKKTCTD